MLDKFSKKILIQKIASTIEMSFDIPETEKQKAQDAINALDKVLSSLDVAKDHIEYMYEPFKNSESVSPESLHNVRGVVDRYKEQIKKNFSQTNKHALMAYAALDEFKSDTHIDELNNTFKKTMGDLTDQVNILMKVFGNLESADFKNQLVSACDSIFKAAFEVTKLVNERILDFLNNNIIGKDWIADTKKEVDFQISSKVPYITQLFEERKEILEPK